MFSFSLWFALFCFWGFFCLVEKKMWRKVLKKCGLFSVCKWGGVARPFSLLCMNVKKKIMHRCNRVAQTSLDSIIYNDQKPTHPHAIVIYSHFFRGGIRFYPIFFSKCLKASQHHEHELSDPPPGVLGKHHEWFYCFNTNDTTKSW